MEAEQETIGIDSKAEVTPPKTSLLIKIGIFPFMLINAAAGMLAFRPLPTDDREARVIGFISNQAFRVILFPLLITWLIRLSPGIRNKYSALTVFFWSTVLWIIVSFNTYLNIGH